MLPNAWADYNILFVKRLMAFEMASSDERR